jgi:exodeoxyribonuclease VII large subunit
MSIIKKRSSSSPITPIGDEIKKKSLVTEGVTLTAFLDNIGFIVKKYCGRETWVQCEIISLNQTNGNYYFEIGDTSNKVKKTKGQTAILYKSKVFSLLSKFNESAGSNLTVGMKVLFKIKAQFTAQFGLSLVIEDIDPSYTVGEIEAKANAIRKSMHDKGFSQMNKNLQLPYHLTNIAVISPAGAAGLGDFKVEADVLEKHKLCNFTYFTATFEGANAEESIVNAFKEVHKSGFSNYDSLVFIRGGGAKSSLQSINEEKIITCICRTPIPVITGIGHEKDRVLADEFANFTLDTPSKVAEYITNTIIGNFQRAIDNTTQIFNTTEQILDGYEKKNKLISQNIFNIVENSVSDYESKALFNSEFIYNRSTECITNYENKLSMDIESIHNRAIQIINDVEARTKFVTTEIYNGIESTIVSYDNILSNNMNLILSEISKILEIKEKEAISTISEIRELDPTKVLNRGYSIITIDNRIIDSIEDLKNQKKVNVTLKDGTIELTLNTKKQEI